MKVLCLKMTLILDGKDFNLDLSVLSQGADFKLASRR